MAKTSSRYARAALVIADATREHVRAAPTAVVYVTVAGSGPTAVALERACSELRARVDDELVRAGLALARNVAPRVDAPAGAMTTAPISQPEQPQPPPDVVLVLAVDLTTPPARVAFWFVDPDAYRQTGAYRHSQGRQVIELPPEPV